MALSSLYTTKKPLQNTPVPVASEPVNDSTQGTVESFSEAPAKPEVNTEVFEEFSGQYVFASGVGAWGNVLTLSADGSFEGNYHDSDSAFDEHTEETYGIVYECIYKGTFSPLKKIDDYSYEAEIIYFNREGEIGDLYIEYIDNVRMEHRRSYCYGLEKEYYGLSNSIIFYPVGTPVSVLTESAKSWIHLEEGTEALPFPVIYCDDLSTAFRGEEP